jgi:hypothetical protein
VSHGTIPKPGLSGSPNHVDPGPYWLWDYYFGLIRAQGVSAPARTKHTHVVTLYPATDQRPWGTNGHESKYNFNFFKLYQQPSTRSHLIAYMGSVYDITNETYNVEPLMSYYYVTSRLDQAGTGYTMFEIWYGINDRGKQHSYYTDAGLAWLAVPRGYAVTSVSGTMRCRQAARAKRHCQYLRSPHVKLVLHHWPGEGGRDIRLDDESHRRCAATATNAYAHAHRDGHTHTDCDRH